MRAAVGAASAGLDGRREAAVTLRASCGGLLGGGGTMNAVDLFAGAGGWSHGWREREAVVQEAERIARGTVRAMSLGKEVRDGQ